jgi:uncharacterized membrane protein YfcA
MREGFGWQTVVWRSRHEPTVHVIEAFCLGCAIIAFAGSFLTAANAAKVLRTFGFIEFVCAYLASVNIRLGDKYKLWPGAAGAASPRPRTRRTRIAEYAYLFGVGTLGTVIVYWLLFSST